MSLPVRRAWCRAGRLLPGLTFGVIRLVAGPIELFPPREEPGPFLLWDSQFTLRSGAGYKENVLLAAEQRQDSALAIFGAEWLILRPPIDANSFTFFFSGDDRRYLNHAITGPGQPPATGEQVFISNAAYKRTVTEDLTLGLSLTHLYTEQVLDASEFGGDPGSVWVSGHGLIGTPTARWTLPAHFYAEVGLPVTREILKAPVSSYWEWGPKVTVGWNLRANGRIEASFAYVQRPFDTRQQADALGVPIPDTRLTTYDRRTELVWKQTWDAHRHFQTTARLFHVHRTENGEGFSDYDRFGASGTVRLDFRHWLLLGTVRWSTYDFPVQIVSVFDPVPRTREEFELEARIEYRWNDRWRNFAEFVHEQQRSNVPADDYHSHVWQVGVEHDF